MRFRFSGFDPPVEALRRLLPLGVSSVVQESSWRFGAGKPASQKRDVGHPVWYGQGAYHRGKTGYTEWVTTITLDSPSLGQNDTAIPTKRVLLLKPRGFCAGVVRAIDIVQIALETFGAPIYVRKEIVHNSYVVTDLAKKGAIFVNELDEVPEGARVIYSAHGVSPAVRQRAKERNLKVIDATCPLVTKVHLEAIKFSKQGYSLVLVGHRDHEEVEGTQGEAPSVTQVVSTRDKRLKSWWFRTRTRWRI